MFSQRSFLILFCFKCALCLQRKLCYDDDECLMNAVIDRVYPKFIAGMSGVEPSDPLRLDAVFADLPTMRYVLYNASMTGLKDCGFLKLNHKRLNTFTLFEYAIACPTLTMQATYEMNGFIDLVPVEGKGTCKIIYENYHITINGKHEKVPNEEGKLHVNILEFEVTPILQGQVKGAEYTNLIFNKQECDNRMKILEEMTRVIVMDVFMNKYIQNLKNFYKKVPIEDLHYKYVN